MRKADREMKSKDGWMGKRKVGMDKGWEGGWKKERCSCFISTCTSENVTKSPDS